MIYLHKLENEIKIYLEQLEKKDKHIKELEAQLANIAMAGVTKSITTNNINNKILNISSLDLNDDKIKSILDSKFDHIDSRFDHIDSKFNHIDNKFNHPSQETISRINKFTNNIFRTDELGTILILSNGTEYWSKFLK